MGPPAGALHGTCSVGCGVPASPVSWGSWWNCGHAPASLTLEPDPLVLSISQCAMYPVSFEP